MNKQSFLQSCEISKVCFLWTEEVDGIIAWNPNFFWSGLQVFSTGQPTAEKVEIVSDTNLISITETATEAFKDFDWAEHDGKGVRLFVQGFG